MKAQVGYSRNRIVYFIMVIITIVAGLMTRVLKTQANKELLGFLGDALWAFMVFMILGCIFRNIKGITLGISALAFSYLIEISQLYHGDLIDEIRKTTIGGLVLGYGFSYFDLVAYFLGIVAAFLVDLKINSLKQE